MARKLRVGILTAAHVHTGAYVSALAGHELAEISAVWDDEVRRGEEFAAQSGIAFQPDLDALLADSDAVVVTSENLRHVELGLKAAARCRHILCEKPLVTTEEHGDTLLSAAEKAGVKLMTAFPCRFAPPYLLLRKKIRDGAIGKVRAICATNRGRCPFGWFVDRSKSGGGAMIDHVVHVADLLRDLLQEEPCRVQAQIGSNIYGESWEDTAMLTIDFPSGVFASLDSSWSRPQTYRTWGDVTMNVVGDNGTLEMNMFGSELQITTLTDRPAATSHGWGSNTDQAMIDEFIQACIEDRPPLVTGFDGFQAARVAMAGYRSVAAGQPVEL